MIGLSVPRTRHSVPRRPLYSPCSASERRYVRFAGPVTIISETACLFHTDRPAREEFAESLKPPTMEPPAHRGGRRSQSFSRARLQTGIIRPPRAGAEPPGYMERTPALQGW